MYGTDSETARTRDFAECPSNRRQYTSCLKCHMYVKTIQYYLRPPLVSADNVTDQCRYVDVRNHPPRTGGDTSLRIKTLIYAVVATDVSILDSRLKH